jgi:NADH:ubiquinone oxidoreductase subunit E
MDPIRIKIKQNAQKTTKNGFKTMKNGKCCEYCDKGTMHLIRKALKCFR